MSALGTVTAQFPRTHEDIVMFHAFDLLNLAPDCAVFSCR